MNKNKYIEQEIFQLTEAWGSILLLVGAAIILSLSFLDYIVTPENFSRFFVYRLISALLYIPLLFLHSLNKKYNNKTLQLLIFLAAPIIAIIMVEAMILSFGGHQSPYYAGMIIVFAFIIGFLPLSTLLAVTLTAATLLTYVVPILLFDTITNYRIFINNIFFLFAIACVGLVWRSFTRSLLTRKLTLEYDLAQDKEQLKIYSNQLEELVAQRTRELVISEQKYRGLFDNASDGVAVYDINGIIVNVNRKFCELHGFPEEALIGTNIRVLDADKDDAEKEARLRRILDGETSIFETRHYRKDGETILLEVSAKGLYIDGDTYIQAFHRDISDKKRLQEQLFQSQKMESVGMLAGGLAHDFNNLITAILGHVELLNLDEKLDANAKRMLAIIESSSRRASQMISKLLKFARKGTVDVQPVELNSVVRDTAELISKTLSRRSVEVRLELDNAIPHIMGDPIQLEQVIMNLMVNAADAMSAGGVVSVATSTKILGREAAQIHPLLAPGSYVVLSVVDTGSGISENIMDKIFDPFFTTKAQGKGTGLGLAMIYGIVKDHKGVVTVASQAGKGTTFEVYIPSAPVSQVVQSYFPESTEPGMGSVLVVEDHSDTLKFVSEIVQSLGFNVISEGNAVGALQIFKGKSEEIALVITDIFMPVLDGRDLIKSCKSIKPSVKVMAMSGYHIGDFLRKEFPVDDFLQKPFDSIELINKVNKLVRSPKSSLS